MFKNTRKDTLLRIDVVMLNMLFLRREVTAFFFGSWKDLDYEECLLNSS
jgi:hypothetical protein